MADVKTFQVFTGAYAEHPLPKSQFRFGLGIMSWQDTEQELLWQFLVEMKEIIFANFFKGQTECRKSKIFFCRY
jgi:hypothetical protein